jgi:hypothetical protein
MEGEMRNRVYIIMIAFLVCVATSGGADAAGSNGDVDLLSGMEGPVIGMGLFNTGMNILLISYNSSSLELDEPSRIGGFGGIILGTAGMAYGLACFMYDDPVVFMAGLGCVSSGAVSFWYGIRSLGAVRRKYFEEKQRDLTVAPIIVGDEEGKVGPGVMISCGF